MTSKEATTSSGPRNVAGNVLEALQTISEIQELLSCNSCLRFMESPIILWNCDHAFCGFCIAGRDACPLCNAPSWTEDKLEIKFFTDIAKLSVEMKKLLQECRQNGNVEKNDSGNTKQDHNQLISSSTNADVNGPVGNGGTTHSNAPPHNVHDVSTAATVQSSGTDNDIEHVKERLQEFLMSNGKTCIAPIEELQVNNMVDNPIVDTPDNDDPNKVQNNETETSASASNENHEKMIENQTRQMSESEMETQLDNKTAHHSNSSEDKMSQRQKLLAKVAKDAIDASLREICSQEEAYVNDSTVVDASAVEPHELLPLNIQRDKQITDQETSASLDIDCEEPKIKKRKSNLKKACTTKTSSNGMHQPHVLFKSKAAPACAVNSINSQKTRKKPVATATRRKKDAKNSLKFKIMPKPNFPDIAEDYEESQMDSTSPLFQPAPIIRLNPGKDTPAQNGIFEVNKSFKSPICQAVSPLIILKKPGVINHKKEAIPKPVTAVKTGSKTLKSSKKNRKGEAPLHIAAIKGDIEDIKSLIAQNVPLNDKDNAGWTPLVKSHYFILNNQSILNPVNFQHEACHHGHIDVVEHLLSAGALINIPGCDNETPLMDAARQGHHNIVKLLVSIGADINLRSCYGLTALDLTTSDLVKQVIEEHQVLTQATNGSLNSQSFSNNVPDNIVLSHSSSLKLSDLKQGATILNAVINSKDISLVTHHITPIYEDRRSPRTLKYLQSVAKGIWIVGSDWLDSCIESRFWVREQSYELLGSKEDLIEGGPRRSRINKSAQYPPIFHGCHFYLYGSFKSPGLSKQHAAELIKLAGGTMLTREPKPDSDSVQSCIKVPYHARSDSPQYFYTYYVVYDSTNGIPTRCVRRGKVCPVPLTWVLDCISQFYMCEIPE